MGGNEYGKSNHLSTFTSFKHLMMLLKKKFSHYLINLAFYMYINYASESQSDHPSNLTMAIPQTHAVWIKKEEIIPQYSTLVFPVNFLCEIYWILKTMSLVLSGIPQTFPFIEKNCANCFVSRSCKWHNCAINISAYKEIILLGNSSITKLCCINHQSMTYKFKA